MKGLEALAKRMGVPSDDGILYTPAPVPADKHLMFAKDVHGMEYGFRPIPRDPSILECFYMRWEKLGHMPVSTVQIVTDDTADVPLNGKKAAIIYRRAEGKHMTCKLFYGSELGQAYVDQPDYYAGYDPNPIVFANGLVVARKFSAKGLQWQAEDRARMAKSK
ncbi:MAG: hypothetical protein WAV21_00860 [Minisyncoccia bacterium]